MISLTSAHTLPLTVRNATSALRRRGPTRLIPRLSLIISSLPQVRSVEVCGVRCSVAGRAAHSGLLRVGSPFDFPPFAAGLDEGILPFSLPILVYIENPY